MQGLNSSPFQVGRTGTLPPTVQPASSETTFGPTARAQADPPSLDDFASQPRASTQPTAGGVVIHPPKAPVPVEQPAQQFATPGANSGSVELGQLALAATLTGVGTTATELHEATQAGTGNASAGCSQQVCDALNTGMRAVSSFGGSLMTSARGTCGPVSQRMSEVDCSPVREVAGDVCKGFGDCCLCGLKVVCLPLKGLCECLAFCCGPELG